MGPGGERRQAGRLGRRAGVALVLALAVSLWSCGGDRSGLAGGERVAAFQGIGSLPGDDASEALAVSADGSVVVGASLGSDSKRHAIRWTSMGGLQALGVVAGGATSTARAASHDGSVIVGQADAPGSSAVAFRWTPVAGMETLPALTGSTLCTAAGVSGDGSLIVGTCLLAGNAGFRWTQAAGVASLGQFGGGTSRSSNAMAVSADGSTIVGSGHPVLTGAVAWTAAGQVSVLGHLPQHSAAVATAVSRDGSAVVGYSTDGLGRSQAFRWTETAGMGALGSGQEGLGDLVAAGMSGDAGVMVGWATSAPGEAAVIWSAASGWSRLEDFLRTRYLIELNGWTLRRATGISDNGLTLVGQGRNPQGRLEGWVLNLPAHGF
jgi:probable HAF family extracellular repeat protein